MPSCSSSTTIAADAAIDYEGLWRHFVTKHAKYYSPHETMSKYRTFKDNVDLINAHNAQNRSYTLAINKYADMTRSEFARNYLGLNAHHVQQPVGEGSAPLLSASPGCGKFTLYQ